LQDITFQYKSCSNKVLYHNALFLYLADKYYNYIGICFILI